MIRDDVITRVESQLPTISHEQAVDFVSRAEEHILARTKRRAVPDGASWLWADIAVAIYKDSQGNAPVSSIKRGDTQINYAAASGTELSRFNAKLAAISVVIGR